MDSVLLYKELGRSIAARRGELDLTQAAVAQRAGISRASLANIEVGRQKLQVHQLYQLAVALDLDGPEKLLPLKPAAKQRSEGNVSISDDGVTARQRAQIQQVYESIMSFSNRRSG